MVILIDRVKEEQTRTGAQGGDERVGLNDRVVSVVSFWTADEGVGDWENESFFGVWREGGEFGRGEKGGRGGEGREWEGNE